MAMVAALKKMYNKIRHINNYTCKLFISEGNTKTPFKCPVVNGLR